MDRGGNAAAVSGRNGGADFTQGFDSEHTQSDQTEVEMRWTKMKDGGDEKCRQGGRYNLSLITSSSLVLEQKHPELTSLFRKKKKRVSSYFICASISNLNSM